MTVKTVGEIHVFEGDLKSHSDHPAVKALEGLSFGNVKMPHGFRLQDIDGKTYIIPLDRKEYEDRVLSVFPDEDSATVFGCNDNQFYCEDTGCGFLRTCKRLWDPNGRYYYCACSN